MKFYPDKLIQTIIKGLPSVKWSNSFSMAYIENTKQNLNLIFNSFRGIAWVNTGTFFNKLSNSKENSLISVDAYRKRKLPLEYRTCPEEFLEKLELKHYAMNTARTYISMFERFINAHSELELIEIDEGTIRNYLLSLLREGKSDSYTNQMINSIKFYYEVVMEMPNRFYSIERPRTKEALPKVISVEEVQLLITNTSNIKHKCII
ncbi:MAG: phage integrase N-terminal SAM-like domain-containing protein, partial [Crocinitomicaceae bacterium]|nr:phage integrase N-terminal SAM-like domain-containing protein [Crocinitomicaceae bacterium]